MFGSLSPDPAPLRTIRICNKQSVAPSAQLYEDWIRTFGSRARLVCKYLVAYDGDSPLDISAHHCAAACAPEWSAWSGWKTRDELLQEGQWRALEDFEADVLTVGDAALVARMQECEEQLQLPSPPGPINFCSPEFCEVERIVGCRPAGAHAGGLVANGLHTRRLTEASFLVKWRGREYSHASWESMSRLDAVEWHPFMPAISKLAAAWQHYHSRRTKLDSSSVGGALCADFPSTFLACPCVHGRGSSGKGAGPRGLPRRGSRLAAAELRTWHEFYSGR